MKFDQGVYLFRKMLRDALSEQNPAASAEGIKAWVESCGGRPKSYCSGNILLVPQASTPEAEVKARRAIAADVINATIESNSLNGDERAAFMQARLAEIEQRYG